MIWIEKVAADFANWLADLAAIDSETIAAIRERERPTRYEPPAWSQKKRQTIVGSAADA